MTLDFSNKKSLPNLDMPDLDLSCLRRITADHVYQQFFVCLYLKCAKKIITNLMPKNYVRSLVNNDKTANKIILIWGKLQIAHQPLSGYFASAYT